MKPFEPTTADEADGKLKMTASEPGANTWSETGASTPKGRFCSLKPPLARVGAEIEKIATVAIRVELSTFFICLPPRC